jgi:C-terminal processing protease CtpA/Prc
MKLLSFLFFLFVLLAAKNPQLQLKADTPAEKINEVDKYFSFARLYGYIRYFYPGDAAAALDWDKFAYYGASVLGNSSSGKLKDDINTLFLSVAPEINIHNQKDEPRKTDQPHKTGQNLKPVYWQHLGDGKGCIGYPYKSMRVNRPALVLPESTNDYATISMNLPAEQVAGRELKLNGSILADPVYTGTPSLIIVVKEKGKDAKRFSSEGQRISAEDWVSHSITAKIPDSIERVTIVAQSITLSGSVKFDNLSWWVKETQEWQEKELINFNGIDSVLFNRLWRRFRPSQDIELGGTKEEQWVSLSRAKGDLKEVDPLFAIKLPEDELLTKSIGSGLSVTFPFVIHAATTAHHPLPKTAGYQELMNRMEAIPFNDFKAENLYCRLANVIILWNKIQHFHPDNPLTTHQWEEQLRKAIGRSLLDKTLEDHRNTLTQMIAPIKDSHMTLYYSSIIREDYYLPLQWEKIENKLVITNVFDPSLPFSKGDIVTHVNGMTADLYWKHLSETVNGATVPRKESKKQGESLTGKKGSRLHLKTVKNPREIIVERTLTEFEFNNFVKETKKYSQYEQLKPAVYYVDLRVISWTDLQSHLQELTTAEAIIFDVRGYPSWQTHNIVSYFTHKPVSQMKYRTPAIIYPDRLKIEFLDRPIDTLQPQQPYIAAKKWFLTDGKAISYAEDFLNLVSYYKLGTIVGEPTAGTTGTVNMCYLFGGLSTPWTGMRVMKQDGSLFNGKGVQPTHPVKKTIKGIREGRDEYIEYVLKESGFAH